MLSMRERDELNVAEPRKTLGERYEAYEQRRAFNEKVRIAFYQTAAGRIQLKVPVKRMLTGQYLAHTRRGKKPDDRVGMVIQQILADFSVAGGTVAKAMGPWVSPSEVAIIAAAEAAGGEEPAKAYDRCAEMLERRERLVAAATKPLRYTGVLLLLFIASLIGLVMFWLPEAASLRPRELMPEATGNLFDLCVWLRSWWPVAVVLLAVGVATVWWSLANTVRGGKVGKVISKLPPFSIYEVYQSANFADIMASMLGGGVKERDALTLLREYSGKWQRARIDDIADLLVKNGRKLGSALLENKYEFPEFRTAYFMAELLDLPKFQEKMGVFADREIKRHVERIHTTSTVVGYIVMALLSNWVAFVLYATLYAMASTFTI